MKNFEEMTLDELLSVDPSDIPIEKLEEFGKWLEIRIDEEDEALVQY